MLHGVANKQKNTSLKKKERKSASQKKHTLCPELSFNCWVLGMRGGGQDWEEERPKGFRATATSHWLQSYFSPTVPVSQMTADLNIGIS